MKKLEWVPIDGFGGYYEVSNTGNVKSVSRIMIGGTGGSTIHNLPERIMKLTTNKKGYLQVCLHANKVQQTRLVHRLVAEAFVKNPKNKPYVNHIDCNKQNNCADNLEWVTNLENQQHANRNGLYQSKRRIEARKQGAIKRQKPVRQLDLWGKTIAEYPSIKDAQKQLGICQISAVCLKRSRKTAGGYQWEFV